MLLSSLLAVRERASYRHRENHEPAAAANRARSVCSFNSFCISSQIFWYGEGVSVPASGGYPADRSRIHRVYSLTSLVYIIGVSIWCTAAAVSGIIIVEIAGFAKENERKTIECDFAGLHTLN